MRSSRSARPHARRRALLGATSLAVLAALLAPAAAAADEPVAATLEDDGVRLVVGYDDDATSADIAAAEEAAAVDATPGAEALEPLGVRVVEAEAAEAAEAVAALQADPQVESVELDVLGTPDAGVIERVPADPVTSALTAYRTSRLPEGWARTTGEDAVTIAVVDEGFDTSHPDLAGQLEPGFDVVSRSRDVSGPSSLAQPSHGTTTSLVAGARQGNGFGTAGACWSCRLLPVSVLTRSSRLWMSNVAEGIAHAVDAGADIVSVSISSDRTSLALEAAVQLAEEEGVLVVSSAGNRGDQAERWPAAYPEVVGVAGTSQHDVSKRAAPSSYGPWVSLAAPYQHIVTTRDGAAYEFNGTSSAAPAVAGIAGLLKSARPDLDGAGLRAALEGTAVAVDYVAHGRVDAAAALAEVMGDAWTTSVLPARPGAVTAVETPAGIEVTWTHAGEWPADSFTVTVEPGAAPVEVAGSARSTVVPGLFSLPDLKVSVTATNAAGTSPPGVAGEVEPMPEPDPTPTPGPPDDDGPAANDLPDPPKDGARSAFLGDWDGDGVATPGWFQGGHWYLRNTPMSGGTEVYVRYGLPGDQPVVGDWDGDGRDELGAKRRGEIFLSDSADAPRTAYRFSYGLPTDQPVAGDWDGDGRDTIAAKRGSTYYLRRGNGASSGYTRLSWGLPSDVPVAGDWVGRGWDTLGAYRGGRWYLAQTNTDRPRYWTAQYGIPSDLPVVGPHEAGGWHGLGAVRGNEWWLRSTTADETLQRITF